MCHRTNCNVRIAGNSSGNTFSPPRRFVIWPMEKRTCSRNPDSMNVFGTKVEKRTSDRRNQLELSGKWSNHYRVKDHNGCFFFDQRGKRPMLELFSEMRKTLVGMLILLGALHQRSEAWKKFILTRSAVSFRFVSNNWNCHRPSGTRLNPDVSQEL